MVKLGQVKVEKFEQGKKYLTKFIFIGQLPVWYLDSLTSWRQATIRNYNLYIWNASTFI